MARRMTPFNNRSREDWSSLTFSTFIFTMNHCQKYVITQVVFDDISNLNIELINTSVDEDF